MNQQIVVIGAGASGMAAATKLLSNGFQNIRVLEAESRMGGRVHSIPYGANVLDMGAQWCHGQTNNVVYDMARNRDLLQPNILRYDAFNMVQSDGTLVPNAISDKLMQLANRILDGYNAEMKQYQGSLGAFIMDKYLAAIRTAEFADVDEALAQQFIEFFHKYENSYEASDSWFQASCKGYTDYWNCEGDLLLNWRDKGYKTVFDLLMNTISDATQTNISIKPTIEYNKEVSCVYYSTDASTQPKANRIICTDGSTISADHVICTVSLGVLKERHQSMFQPTLPLAKVNAIDGLTLGTVDKIYVEFAAPFWPVDWTGFSLLWTQRDAKKLRDRRADSDDDNRWLEDVFGFYRVDYQPNILCGWISGESARHMEQLSDSQVKRGVMKLFRQFLTTMPVPEPVSIKRSQWYSNPHFRGSYTFKSTKTDLLRTCPADLAAPLTNTDGHPVLQFAGEATHDHYYSTVHGAVESGWREADRLIEWYRPKSRL